MQKFWLVTGIASAPKTELTNKRKEFWRIYTDFLDNLVIKKKQNKKKIPGMLGLWGQQPI